MVVDLVEKEQNEEEHNRLVPLCDREYGAFEHSSCYDIGRTPDRCG